MQKVRCAVIGAGWWASASHLPALRANKDVELVAVQSLDESRIAQIARDFGAAKGFTRWQDLLEIEKLDAVVIASTPNVHFEQPSAALNRGLHVLVEKPITFTARQAEELVQLAEKKRLHFVTGYPWHYTRHAAEAKKLIAAGELGDVKLFSITMMDECLGLYQGLPWVDIFGDGRNPECEPRPYVEPGRRSYADPKIAGGGQIYSQVSHVAAYLTYLTGKQPKEVFARFDNTGAEVDVYNAVNVKLDGGAIAGICSTGATGKSKRMCHVVAYGTKAVISLELFDGTMKFQRLADGTTREFPALSAEEIYPMAEPSKNLVDVVLKRAENRSPGVLGLAAMKVVEGACKSVQTGCNVKIPWW